MVGHEVLTEWRGIWLFGAEPLCAIDADRRDDLTGIAALAAIRQGICLGFGDRIARRDRPARRRIGERAACGAEEADLHRASAAVAAGGTSARHGRLARALVPRHAPLAGILAVDDRCPRFDTAHLAQP